jgi:hypothetical protein
MSDNPTVSQQYAFSVGEDGDTDGIEPSEESVETDLEAFGANVDHRERDTRIAQPEASSFGIDDRATVTRSDGGEQQALFADTDDDQQTLTGERAASQCLFESHDAESDDDPDAVITASDEPPRALADGGQTITETDEKRACKACGSLNNGLNGFVHDTTDESWTDYDALCRECFIEIASDDMKIEA